MRTTEEGSGNERTQIHLTSPGTLDNTGSRIQYPLLFYTALEQEVCASYDSQPA